MSEQTTVCYKSKTASRILQGVAKNVGSLLILFNNGFNYTSTVN